MVSYCENSNDPAQPAKLHSLIKSFVNSFIDSIVSNFLYSDGKTKIRLREFED